MTGKMFLFSWLLGSSVGLYLLLHWWRSCLKRISGLFKLNICRTATKRAHNCVLPVLPDTHNVEDVPTSGFWSQLSNFFIDDVDSFINDALIIGSPMEMQASLGYVFGVQGKQVRARIFHLVSQACLGSPNVALAAAVELEHSASLLHDDVVDCASTRRGRASHCLIFGSMRSVLHGDYLVAVLVGILADLGICDITRSFGSSMEDLVRGELMQISNHDLSGLSENEIVQRLLGIYLEKCYCKTAVLFVVCVDAAATMSTHDHIEALRELGLCMGMCFQIVDDMLDFRSEPHGLKPSDGFDLASGNATAPVIFAAKEFPEILIPQIKRRFALPADRSVALDLVRRSKGIEASVQLATHYANRAKIIIAQEFPVSEYRAALENIVDVILNRTI